MAWKSSNLLINFSPSFLKLFFEFKDGSEMIE